MGCGEENCFWNYWTSDVGAHKPVNIRRKDWIVKRTVGHVTERSVLVPVLGREVDGYFLPVAVEIEVSCSLREI